MIAGLALLLSSSLLGDELFRLRRDGFDGEHGLPKFAAALGDRDGDGTEEFVLVESSPARIEVRSGRTLERMRAIDLEPAGRLKYVRQAALGGDLNGDGWRELYMWFSREAGRATLARVSLDDGQIVWETTSPHPRGGFDWLAFVPVLRTPDGEQLVIGEGTVRDGSSYPIATGRNRGGFVLIDARTGRLRIDRTHQEPALDPSTGVAVTGVGDVSADGYEDFAVSVPWQEVSDGARGVVEIRSGADGTLMRTIVSERSEARGACEGFGTELSSVEDIDGDGARELAICVSRKREWREGERIYSSYSEEIELRAGRSDAVLAVLDLPEWDFAGFAFGHPTVLVPDLDGDGKRDLIVANPGAGNQGASGAILAFATSGKPIGEVQGAYDYCILGHPFAIVERASDSGVLTIVTACKRVWRMYDVGRKATSVHDAPK